MGGFFLPHSLDIEKMAFFGMMKMKVDPFPFSSLSRPLSSAEEGFERDLFSSAEGL